MSVKPPTATATEVNTMSFTLPKETLQARGLALERVGLQKGAGLRGLSLSWPIPLGLVALGFGLRSLKGAIPEPSSVCQTGSHIGLDNPCSPCTDGDPHYMII